MATIQERITHDGKRRFRAQIRLKGFTPITATFERKTDAREWVQQTEADMKAGRYLRTAESKRHTFGEMIDRYSRQVLPCKRPGTREAQGPQLRWWKEQIGHCLLSDVTPALIAEKRDELARGTTHYATPRSPSTVNRYLAALSHCYSISMKEWGWVDDNPLRKVSKPRQPDGRIRFLSHDERERLLYACRESRNRHLHPIVVLALSTGMRRNEILGLTWDRVDFERQTVTLLPVNTKTSTARVVPLVGRALEELSKVAQESGGACTSLVFPAPNAGDGDGRSIDIRNAWDHAVQRAEIKNFRFHDLRHSAASYLAMNGATLAEISEVLGHKTLQMVKRYAHLTEAHTSAVVRRMNTAIFGDP